MPVAVSYPGVYIEEIPSGVRTITGVATSIAAFVGWAPQGPTDRAELVLSWSDFERKFGGLNAISPLGHSVSQFFFNGGQRAYVVRVIAGEAEPGASEGGPSEEEPGEAAAPATSATVALGTLTIAAKDPGAWANRLAILIKRRTDEPERFQLRIVDASLSPFVPLEVFDNLSMARTDFRFVENVLKNESLRVTATLAPDATDEPPPDTVIPTEGDNAGQVPDEARLTGGDDGGPLADRHAAITPTVTAGVAFRSVNDSTSSTVKPGP